MAASRAKPKGMAQRGIVLIGLLALLVMGALAFLVGQLQTAGMRRDQDLATLQALAQAKDALIAYAVSVDLSGTKRPGDLPCPDRDNDGKAGTTVPLVTSCGNAAGTTFQVRRLGRLPWLDLGLPDIRDASGERLWYAVSSNFKENTRATTLNSDSAGTITVRDANGNIIFDGSATTGVVAVIIAPGSPLMRQDGLQQDRSAANVNDPRHYLDNIASEDNADFDEITTKTNGFFNGPVRNAVDPKVIVANDRLIVITREEIMAAMEKRVAAEVMACLTNYAAYNDGGAFNNGGRYPWPASLATSAAGNYDDTDSTLFGRIPDLMLNTAATNAAMLSAWGSVPNCYVNGNWFKNNWREQVFYAVADAYKPGTGATSCLTPANCLTVDSVTNKQVVVVMAGRKVGAQSRSSAGEKAQAAQYLEAENALVGTAFVAKSSASPFNDRVLYR